jgi:Family of unknown function (DUF5681)
MSEEQNQENPVPENTIVDNGTQVSVAAPQAEGEIAADACVSNTVDSLQQALASEVTPPADNTAKIQRRGRPFEPGQSGNPNGRPRGTRNRATLAAEALINNKAQDLAEKALELALKGDSAMLRGLLSTFVPPCRERPAELDLPKIETAADAIAACSVVFAALAEGNLTPGQAREVMELLSSFARTFQAAELEARVAALEEMKR